MHSRVQLFPKLAFVFSLIYLGTGLIISTPVALEFHHGDASEQQQEKTPLLPRFPDLENPPTSGVPAVDIHPRIGNVIETWYSGWELTLDDFGVFLPDASASSALWQFYDLIKYRAWFLEMAHEAPASDVTFTFGALQLTFFNATRIISWGLIYDFVQNMKIRTGMGMVGRYNAFLFHRLTGDMIFVKLTLAIPPAVAA